MYKNSLQSLSGLCRLFFYCHKGGRKIFKRKGRRKKSVYEADNETHFKADRGRVQQAGL